MTCDGAEKWGACALGTKAERWMRPPIHGGRGAGDISLSCACPLKGRGEPQLLCRPTTVGNSRPSYKSQSAFFTRANKIILKFSSPFPMPIGSKALARVDLYFDCVSPYTHLALHQYARYATLWPIHLRLRPFFLGGVMHATGNS